MLICSSLPFFLRKKSLCGSPFKLSCGLELCTLTPSIDLLEPWVNKDKWIGIFPLDLVTRLHRSFPPKSMLNVLQVQPVRSFIIIISLFSCMGPLACIKTWFLFSVVYSDVSMARTLCKKLNVGLAKFLISTTIFIEGFLCFQSVISFSHGFNSACGAFIESDPVLFFHQNWSLAESACSLTWALKVVCVALEAIANLLSYSRFSVILTTRASNSFCAMATGNVTYMYSN